MNPFLHLPVTRWSYSPVSSLQSAMDRLEQAKAIGYQCTACHKVLIDHIVIRDGRKFHEDCFMDKATVTNSILAFSGFFFILLTGLNV